MSFRLTLSRLDELNKFFSSHLFCNTSETKIVPNFMQAIIVNIFLLYRGSEKKLSDTPENDQIVPTSFTSAKYLNL